MKEYESVQEQIRATRDESRAIERNSVLAIGVFWAFLIKQSTDANAQHIPAFAWWLPVLIAALAASRSAALGFKLQSLSLYVRRVESEFLKADEGLPCGWEHFQKLRGGFVRISSWAFWVILVGVTIVVARIHH